MGYFGIYSGNDYLEHRSHKYISKKRGKNGRWIYIYKPNMGYGLIGSYADDNKKENSWSPIKNEIEWNDKYWDMSDEELDELRNSRKENASRTNKLAYSRLLSSEAKVGKEATSNLVKKNGSVKLSSLAKHK